MKNNEKSQTVDTCEVYEIGYLLVPTIPEENVPAFVTALKDILEKHKALIISEEMPKSIVLAYEITKRIGNINKVFDTAYFGWIKFEMSKEGVVALREDIDGNDEILRFLLTTTVKENTLYTPKLIKEKLVKADEKEDGQAKVLPEDIDKSIDDLVAE